LLNEQILACLDDNVEYFNNLLSAKTINTQDQHNALLNAALVASKEIVNLFLSKFNAKEEENLVFHAMCSGDDDWVLHLIQENNIDVVDPKYAFEYYANLLKNPTFLSCLQQEQQTKSSTKSTSLSPATFFRWIPQEINQKCKIRGELLVSFDEIILGLLESLYELPNEVNKKILLNVLSSSKYSCETVARYAYELDRTIGEQFSILYCCKHPEKWHDPYMKEYKKTVITSYAERSLEYIQDQHQKLEAITEKEKWLIMHAREFVLKFLHKNTLKVDGLTVEEKQILDQALVRIEHDKSLRPSTPNRFVIENLEKEKEELEKIFKEEGEINSAQLEKLDIKKLSSSFSLDGNYKEISKHSKEWQEIYEVIGKTPSRKLSRDYNKMFEIFSAILYKQQTKCRWTELPQTFPFSTTVRHYYYEWMSNPEFVEALKNINERSMCYPRAVLKT
jgi:hypothetical protein